MMKSKESKASNRLDYFFEFVNFKLADLDFDNLISIAMSYVRFAYAQDGATSKSIYDKLTESAFERSENELIKTKELLERLQSYSKQFLDRIIIPSDAAISSEHKTGWELYIKDGKFVISFSTENDRADELDIHQETQNIKAVFTDLLVNTPLVPNQFKTCEECGNYFYQKTKREMKFCSTRCSNRNRQRAFISTKGSCGVDVGGGIGVKGSSIKIPKPKFKKKK
ncbi:MAG: CGNR zinc finger domain-containing protein [Desulfobacter sp.]|nr:MAG: CGNR zinc finger domain-containing protein [Desulfobacter sp.]